MPATSQSHLFEARDSGQNSLWAATIVEELCRLGCQQFVLSPGSRSTPLALAVRRNPKCRYTIITDERSAGFYALGISKSGSSPSVLICTSGTAVANYYPAVIEAAQDFIPLIVLSADRPPRLWDTMSNQTINQREIFGSYTRDYLTLDLPSIEHLDLVTALRQLYGKSASMATPGPVHLNCPFDEPLAPTTDAGLGEINGWTEWVEETAAKPASTFKKTTITLPQDNQNGLVIFGRCHNHLWREQLTPFAKTVKENYVCYGDVCSSMPGTPPSQELLTFAGKVDWVIQFGGPVVNKPLLLTLANNTNLDWTVYQPYPVLNDPVGKVSATKSINNYNLELEDTPDNAPPTINDDFANRLEMQLEGADGFFEPALAADIGSHWPTDYPIFVGNSMPIRSFDYYRTINNKHIVYANRGASGIDGNISTACGIARQNALPVIAVVGDLTAIHDLNALRLVALSEQPILLVVVNNGGGGIFRFLPVAQNKKVKSLEFEELFVTPHETDFKKVAKSVNLSAKRCGSRKGFKKILNRFLRKKESMLVEVVIDERQNHMEHRAIQTRLGLNPFSS